MYVCVCLYLGIDTWVHVLTEIVGSHRTWLLTTKLGSSVRAVTFSSLLSHLSIFWDRVSYPTWSSLILLGWLTNELQGSFCLWYFPLLASVPGFLCRLWEYKLRSHACVPVRQAYWLSHFPIHSSVSFETKSLGESGVCLANILPTKPLLQSIDSVLFVVLRMSSWPLSSWLFRLGLTMQFSLALNLLLVYTGFEFMILMVHHPKCLDYRYVL